MNECYICKKKSSFEGLVWYSSGMFEDIYLCRSHYLRWCKSKDCKDINKRYIKAKPTTKAWHMKCETLQKAFDLWMGNQLKPQPKPKTSSEKKR